MYCNFTGVILQKVSVACLGEEVSAHAFGCFVHCTGVALTPCFWLEGEAEESRMLRALGICAAALMAAGFYLAYSAPALYQPVLPSACREHVNLLTCYTV